jgi:ribosome-associated translation inhibitor RaiA
MIVSQEVPVEVHTRGGVPRGAGEFAAGKVRSVLVKHAAEPVLSARVTLTRAADPAVERPAVSQATVDVNGRVIRAEAAERTIGAAVSRVADRLRVQLDRTAHS